MEPVLILFRNITSSLYPLALVFIMTNFKCSVKFVRMAFGGVVLFALLFNVIFSYLFGREIMIRYYSIFVAVPCILLVLLLSRDGFFQHFFNFFTAINVLYFLAIIGKLVQLMEDKIWLDVLVRSILFAFILFLFQHYWRRPYHFLTVHMEKGWGVISVIPFLFFVLVMFLGLYPRIRNDNLVAVILLYGIFCNVYLVIYQVFRNTYELLIQKQQQQAFAIQLESQKQYYEARLGSEEEIRKLKHDMQGHLATAAALLLDGRMEEAADYLCGVANLHKAAQKGIYCKNVYLNAVIHIFEERFRENDIRFEHCVAVHELQLPTPDICLILNNGLQNAQEAVVKLPKEKRVVRLQASVKQGQLLFRIGNPFTGSFRVENGMPMTLKTEPGHGYGLMAICAAVQRLGGSASFCNRKGYFELDIIIALKGNDFSEQSGTDMGKREYSSI